MSPNGDGYNDVFTIRNIEKYPDNELVIFNRWGEKIFETDNALETWKGVTTGGTEVTEGVYFYSYTVVGDNPNDRREGHGNIQLLRGD